MRALAGRGLDEDTPGFDVFTGLWWPLRKKNQAAPRREVAWLVTKLYAAFCVPHVPAEQGKESALAQVLGQCEPPHGACSDAALLTGPVPDWEPAKSQFIEARRFRRRFDALLCTPLNGLEPHLHWALREVHEVVVHGRCQGIDWVQLTDHLSVWDRADEHRKERDVRDIWAEQYLLSVEQGERKR